MKIYASSKKLLTSIRKRGHLGRKAPSPEKKRGVSEDQEGCGQIARRPLLVGLKVGKMLERTSGLNKLMSIVHRMSMELESKFLDSLCVKAETLQRNQSVRNVSLQV